MLMESRHGSGVVLLGSTSIGQPAWTYGPWGASSNVGFSFHGPYDDQLGAQLAHLENISPPIDLSDFGGYYGGRDIRHDGYKPTQADLAPDGVRDWAQYISDLQEFFGGWNFASVDVTTSLGGKENPVHHPNLFGYVESGVRESAYHRPRDLELVLPALWPSPPAPPFFNVTIHGSGLEEITGISVSNQFDPGSWYPWYRLIDGLWAYKPLIDAGGFASTVGYSTVTYSDLHWKAVGLFVEKYGYKTTAIIDNPADPYVYERVYSVDHEFWIEYIQTPPLETEILLRDYVALRDKVYYVLISDRAHLRPEGSPWVATSSIHGAYTTGTASFDVEQTNWVAAHDACEGRVDELIGQTVTGTWYSSDSNRKLSDFAALSSSLGVDIRSTVFFSAVEAVDKIFPSFESNHVEALIELREIGGLLNPVNTLAALTRRAVGGRRIKFSQVLDLLTDFHLTYSLGIAPTISDAMDVAKRSRWLLRRYRQDLTDPVTAYGSYSLQLGDSELLAPFVGAEVVARTKLRAGLSEDSLWAALLPLRAVNLLPTLSNVWDLLPQTFILDYFTNIGDYLEAVDNMMLFLGLEVEYAVHSTSLIYQFTEEDCESYGFSVRKEGQNPGAGYRIYNRWVTGEMPTILPTRLNVFGEPTINFSILGSLLYKRI